MKTVLSTSSMRAADAFTIEEFGIPGFTLMETAGREAARILRTRLRSGVDRVLCVCGTGNNGGDGLVIARVLATHGYAVDVLIVGDEERESPDMAHNRRMIEALLTPTGSELDLTFRRTAEDVIAHFGKATWIVDALLGTGVTGELREPIRSCVTSINAHAATILAIDVPTGLDADTGVAVGPAIVASDTVCIAALKPGVLLNDGPRHAGTVSVVEIGIPGFALRRQAETPGCGVAFEDNDIVALLPLRDQNAHKYSSGTLVVVAGSPGLTGAPVLASYSGLRIGAGAVICATRSSVRETVDRKVVEIMTRELSDNESGIQPNAVDAIASDLDRADALVVGCGLGREPGTSTFIKRLLSTWKGPAVVDADALYALSGEVESGGIDFIRSHSNGRWVLTPHQGEFERLIGAKADWDDRAAIAARMARDWNCVIVLKGNPSVIGIPNEPARFNMTGNAALATAGTGDVLAGMIGGLLAQGLSPANAATAAAFIGGIVADEFATSHNANTMIASDVIAGIADVTARLAASANPTSHADNSNRKVSKN